MLRVSDFKTNSLLSHFWSLGNFAHPFPIESHPSSFLRISSPLSLSRGHPARWHFQFFAHVTSNSYCCSGEVAVFDFWIFVSEGEQLQPLGRLHGGWFCSPTPCWQETYSLQESQSRPRFQTNGAQLKLSKGGVMGTAEPILPSSIVQLSNCLTVQLSAKKRNKHKICQCYLVVRFPNCPECHFQ